MASEEPGNGKTCVHVADSGWINVRELVLELQHNQVAAFLNLIWFQEFLVGAHIWLIGFQISFIPFAWGAICIIGHPLGESPAMCL